MREAFKKKGHDAVSCDLLPTERDGNHYQGNVLDILHYGWDLMIAHPPCTFLSVSGLHWNKRDPLRAQKTEDALEFVRILLEANIGKIALENPVSCISSRIRKPDQIVQPYEFGHDASKRTCLWLKNLPPLPKDPDKFVPGRTVHYGGKQVMRWSNQTDSGQNKLPPSEDRWKIRSETYHGIADAMAHEWG